MELLERDRQLEALDGWLREAAAGQGRVALVGGEAGVGKTALVGRFREMARGRARVLVGACDALSTPRPLGPLLDIAAAAGGELDRLVNQDAPRDRIFRAALTELGAGLTPTLAVIEDAHWADEATLDLLRFLGRRLDAVRALLIVTYREDEVGPRHPLRLVFGDLATAVSIRRLGLAPLSEAGVRVLATGCGFDPAALHRLTGGNPYFASEVLADTTAGPAGIPATVRDAVLARASRLLPPAREVLDAAAVIGSPVEATLLAEVAAPTADAIEACLEGGMLVAVGRAFAFRHELARVAIHGAIPPTRCRALHAAVLAALRTAPAATSDLARLAHHAEAADNGEAVLLFAPAAARRAAALRAHREAADQYARALRFAADRPPAERADLLEASAVACDVTGSLTEAVAAREEAIRIARHLGDSQREGENLARLVNLLVRAGRNAEAESASRASIDLLDALPVGRPLGLAYRAQASLRMLDRDCADAIAWGARAIAVAEQQGDIETIVSAENAVGSAMLVTGDEAGRRHLERSLALAVEANLDIHIALAYTNLGSAYGEVYRFDLSLPYLNGGIAFCAEHDLDSWGWYMLAWKAMCLVYRGEWTEATEVAALVLKQATAAPISRIMALLAVGRVRTRRGDPEAAEALDAAFSLAAPTGSLQRLAPVHAARAEAAWLAGDRERAVESARAALDLAVRHQHAWFSGELSYWCWRAGHPVTPSVAVAPPFALQIAGDWAGAAAAWEVLGCPYEAARANAEGDDDVALRVALETFERLGARPMVAITARRLRELGATGIPRGPRPSTRANAANLTARELEILPLLVAGRRNAEIAARLFLSPKTVDHHVGSILAKLGVHARGDVRAAAARLGIPDAGDQDGELGPPI